MLQIYEVLYRNTSWYGFIIIVLQAQVLLNLSPCLRNIHCSKILGPNC